MVTTNKINSGASPEGRVGNKNAAATTEKKSGPTISERRVSSSKRKDSAVKVELSEEGKALAKESGMEIEGASSAKDGEQNRGADEAKAKSPDEKKRDLVNFYAKQLMKATSKIEIEELSNEAPENKAEEAAPK